MPPFPLAGARRPGGPGRGAGGPADPEAAALEPAPGADESCYALVVDVDAPESGDGLLGAPDEEPCYALVVDVPAPGASERPDPPLAPPLGAPVVRLVSSRPTRPDLHPAGPPRPVRHHRDDRTQRTRPGGRRPDPDRVLAPIARPDDRLDDVFDDQLDEPFDDPLDGLLHPLREADDGPGGPGGASGGPARLRTDEAAGEQAGDAPATGAGPAGSRVAVDPRIRARWIAVRRAEGRRRLRVLVVLVGLLTLATLAVAAVYSPMLDVERVDVSGVDAATAAAVRTAAGVSRGDALLRVNTGTVAARLERLPGIAHAEVSRELPGTLHITVTRRELVGWVSVPAPKGSHAAATVATVDPSGRIVDGALVPPSGLPQLVGISSRGRPGTQIAHPAVAHVASILPPDLRNLATTVKVQRGVVSMGLANGPEIRFGAPDALASKARTALAILGSLRRPVHYIDVRVPSAPVTG